MVGCLPIASKNGRIKQAQADFTGIYAHKAEQNAKKYHIGLDELELIAQSIDCQIKSPEPKKLKYMLPSPRF